MIFHARDSDAGGLLTREWTFYTSVTESRGQKHSILWIIWCALLSSVWFVVAVWQVALLSALITATGSYLYIGLNLRIGHLVCVSDRTAPAAQSIPRPFTLPSRLPIAPTVPTFASRAMQHTCLELGSLVSRCARRTTLDPWVEFYIF